MRLSQACALAFLLPLWVVCQSQTHTAAVGGGERASDGKVHALMDAKLMYDEDNDAMADPGDIVQYSVHITPASPSEPIELEIGLPKMLTLAPVSVVAPHATKNIEKNKLTLRWAAVPSGQADCVFSAVVGSYLPGDHTQVCVQGIVNKEHTTSTLSAAGGATCVPIDGFTKLHATNRLMTDQQYVHPGERVTYRVHIQNAGSRAAARTVYEVTLDHMTYVQGSFRLLSQPMPMNVYTRNSVLYVEMGELAGLSEVEFEYDTVIDDPLLGGVSQVTSQGQVVFETRSLLENGHVIGKQVVRTDDPTTLTQNDPTARAVASKDCPLEESVVQLRTDSTDEVHLGDVITYELYVQLRGAISGSAVYVNDMPPGLQLVAGSVVIQDQKCGEERRRAAGGRMGRRGSGKGEGEGEKPTHDDDDDGDHGNDDDDNNDLCCSIVEGNHYGDKRVVVKILGEGVVLSYKATVANPFQGAGEVVINQGRLEVGSAVIYSDNPDTPAIGDPTMSEVELTNLDYCDMVGVMRVGLEVDMDNDGSVDPGDTIRYTVQIRNQGTIASAGTVFRNKLDPYTTLIVGTATTTCGQIEVGNSAIDSNMRQQTSDDIRIFIGGIESNNKQTCIITFDALVSSALPSTVSQISNQGLITGDNFPAVLTNDGTGAWDTPTVVPIEGTLSYKFALSSVVSLDWNWNGKADPGDGLTYTIEFQNTGSHDMTSLTLRDVLDVNTRLVVGSVTASEGKIRSGNRIGDDRVEVTIDSVSALTGKFTITFVATVNDPFPGTSNSVSNQARLSALTYLPEQGTSGRVGLLSTDPSTTIVDAPTVTPVVASPVFKSVTQVQLQDDNNDGAVNPGEILKYQIIVSNVGNQDALDVVVVDTPDPNTELILGSVKTSQGRVMIGNGVHDEGTVIQILVGTLAGHTGSVTITFAVQIRNDFSGGVSIGNSLTIQGANFESHSESSVDVEAPAVPVDLAFYQTWELFNDADQSNDVSPGDSVLFTVSVLNVGGSPARGVTVQSSIDANAPLDLGTVTTSQGTIVQGNTQGDSTPVINFGDILGSKNAQYSYTVTIVNPIAAGVSSITSQSTASGSNFVSLVSTDPSQKILAYPTIVPLTAAPALALTTTWARIAGTNANGLPDPGDQLRYTVMIKNAGNQAAVDLVVTDVPQSSVNLVAGSVVAPTGTVVSGNDAVMPGDTAVDQIIVTIPELSGDDSTWITFDVEIPSPYLGRVSSISNQATLRGGNVPTIVSDDPLTNFIDDPTVVAINAVPAWVVSTSFESLGALPRSGVLFTSEITNNGNQQAYDVNVTYVFGDYWSIDTSQGITFTPSSCCSVAYLESSFVSNTVSLKRTTAVIKVNTVAVNSNFNIAMTITGDLSATPPRCSQPIKDTDVTDCLTIQVDLTGSQFSTFSQSVVETPSQSQNTQRSLVPNVPLTLGTKGKLYTEIVGLDGSVSVHAANDEKVLKAGDKIQVTANGNIVSQLGTRVTFDVLMDPSVYIVPDTYHIVGASYQMIQNQEHKLSILFDAIPASTTPTPIELVFEAVVLPNFDGIMPMSNKITLTIDDFTALLPEVTPTLTIAGKGGVTLEEHREARSVKQQTKSTSPVVIGVIVFVAFAVLGMIFVGIAVLSRKKAPERYE